MTELRYSLISDDLSSIDQSESSSIQRSPIENAYFLSSHSVDSLDIQSIDPQQGKELSFLPTFLNIMNSLLGAGILSVPRTFVDSGTVLSSLCMLIIAFFSYYVTALVISTQRKTSAQSFAELAEKTLGHWASIALSLLSLLLLMSCLISYVIIASDILFSWFKLGKVNLTEKQWFKSIVIPIYALCIPIALTLPRKIMILSYFSGSNIIFISFFVVVVIYKGLSAIAKYRGINKTVKHFKIGIELFSSLSIYSLSFALSCTIIPIIRFYSPNIKKRFRVTFLALFTVFLMNFLPALICYFQFGDEVQSNMLNTYSDKDVLIIITRGVFFSLSVSSSQWYQC